MKEKSQVGEETLKINSDKISIDLALMSMYRRKEIFWETSETKGGSPGDNTPFPCQLLFC